MEDKAFYSSGCVTGRVPSSFHLAYESGNDRVFYEFHPIKNPKLPFVFETHTVTDHNIVPPDKDTCLEYYYSNILNWHENIEFFYIVSGEGHIRYDADTLYVKAGDIVAVNPNVAHGVIYDSTYEYYYLIVDKDFCTANCIDISTTKLTAHICDTEVAAKFKDIIDVNKTQKKLNEASFRCAVLSFLVSIYEKYGAPGEASNINDKLLENISIALGYIEANLSKKLTLEDIAYEVGFSKYHFLREFKKVTGQTVVDYINVKRCETAKQLFLKENSSVKTVAEKCGFESLSYFGKIFKKYTGLSPSEFKKSSKTVISD